jgi:pimeloyl-ACP methyl ester carboxylesterase
MLEMHHVRRGSGRPLLLLHGLGGSWREWGPVLDGLAAERELIAVDLPGFGETPPLSGKVQIETLADAVTGFLQSHDLLGVDVVGSSMGARLALELARRGVVGATVSLDPGGFWSGWQKTYFLASIWLSIRLIRLLQPVMPKITASPVGRTLLFAQFSAQPCRLSPEVTLDEMRSFAAATSIDELLYWLVYGSPQKGAQPGSMRGPLTIGWGRKDRVCFPGQAKRALELFPDASLHWFDGSGHFPQWDVPREATRLILASTGRDDQQGTEDSSPRKDGP